jgi:hypothetical protein
MYEQNNTTMMDHPKFILPDATSGDFSQAELSEDIDGLQMSFPQVKIPSGGTLQFELPTGDPDNPDYAKNLVGVILANHNANAYWAAGSEYDDSTPPLCQSVDGKTGYGEPGGVCAACMLNKFGSSEKGTGKACKNMRVIYLLQSGEFMPLQISLPPTSIGPYTRFINAAFACHRKRICSSVIQIGLKKASSGGHDYSVATFTKLYDFTGEDLAKIRAYADGFLAQVKDMNQQRAVANEAAAGAICEYTEEPVSLPENGSHFSCGDVINGDREKLPA